MSRPLLLVFLLIVLIVTSQVDWKQPLVAEQEVVMSASEKQLRIAERKESVKEKIILSQEKRIHDLRSTVRDLQEQLKQCRVELKTSNNTSHSVKNNEVDLDIERTDGTHG